MLSSQVEVRKIKTKEMTAAQIIKKRRNDLLLQNGYIHLGIRVLVLLFAGWLFLTQVLILTQAKGNDMFPAVKDGDLVLGFRLQKDYQKNDIVVYTAGGQTKIGRVLGRAGDNIMMDDTGTLEVNGTPQAGEILYPTYAKEGISYPYTVPEDSLFVLCDYRTEGKDSRDYGAISLRHVKGKVITLLRRRGL